MVPDLPSAKDANNLTKALKTSEELLATVQQRLSAAQTAEELRIELLNTARELAENARLLALTNDALVVRGKDGRITVWNPGAEKLFGWTAEEAIGRDLHQLLQTEFPYPHPEPGQLDGGGEVVQTARDGRQMHLLCRWVQDKKTAAILTSYTDITERKRVEDALRRSEGRFRTAISTVSSLLWTNNAEGEMKGPQPGWGNFTGQSEEEYQDYGWASAVHPDDAGATIAAWEKAVAEKKMFFFEHRVRRSDGEWRLCSVRAAPMLDDSGNILEWVGVHHDITEQRRNEAELRESEEFMRSIIESSPDCIKVLDSKGHLLSMLTGEALLGISDLEPLLGKSWIHFWEDAQDQEAAFAAIQTAADGGEGNFVGYFRTLQGEDKWWDVAITPIRRADGKTDRLLAVSRDVTERRKMENSLLLQAAELSRADRSKDEFLAMLAHELRNPLAPLRNAAVVLQDPQTNGQEREQAQQIIGRQIENMSRMIDDLLDVSRISEGKIELRKEPVALEGILTAVTSTMRSNLARRGQELAVSMPEEPVYLEADATRLEQVFHNLLGNACKYSGEGTHIYLTAERLAGGEMPEVVVRVRDDGAGIDPEVLPRVFDLFAQATRTLDREHGGLGIGLTLVSRLVKLHGGSVEAKSEGLGQGSEFVVHLPILREAPPAPVLPPPPRVPDISRRILIVDDNSDSAKSMATLQSRRGHVTRTAFTGPEAVAVATEFLPEVVLLDIGLPGMDGFEVARRLRQMPEMENAFLIAMTGYASAKDQLTATEAGFNEHLAKPVDLALLQEWLRTRV